VTATSTNTRRFPRRTNVAVAVQVGAAGGGRVGGAGARVVVESGGVPPSHAGDDAQRDDPDGHGDDRALHEHRAPGDREADRGHAVLQARSDLEADDEAYTAGDGKPRPGEKRRRQGVRP
jgi:hypothetical protein